MSCKRTLLFLFLCGFAALSVSVKCTPELLEGTSCTIDLSSKNIDKSKEVKWVHLSSELVIHRRNGKIRADSLSGTKIEDNGSLTFQSVSLKNTGKYKYSFYDTKGTETSGEEEIKVFAKAPKPTVRIDCKDGLKLICDAGNRTDLSVSWYKEAKSMNIGELSLKSDQVEANKPYSCRVSNTVSNEESNSVTPSCKDAGTGAPGEALFPSTLFGFDFWIMVSILAGGGALLLLLICVLIICACRSCREKTKQEQDEDELRLRVLQDQNGAARSKHTARGQPAPPIPLEDPCSQTPAQSQAQPKAQTRGRPPPPPEDDEDNPPPLPRPRNKQHRKRHEEPYRLME